MNLDFRVASVDSLIIHFCKGVNLECAKRVQKALYLLKDRVDVKEIIPSYNTILITFDILKYDFYSMREEVLNHLKYIDKVELKDSSKTVEIPTLYSVDVGLDLEHMSKLHNLSIENIIDIHSSNIYYVYAIGFLAGFAYMGDVSKKIATPRHLKPRGKVAKGSVALANTQCAIYPQESAGGWNIIGKTPIELVSSSYANLSLLQIGYRVKFIPIDKDEFFRLGGVI